VERGAPLPVVLAFHGGGGNAEGFEAYAGLDTLADRAGFLVVYPDGTGPLRRRLLTWNAGPDCCGYARTHDVDDVGFAMAVLDDLARRTPVDSLRVYATGHSNGAMMAYRLAAERAERIAAIAVVAGAMDVPAEAFHPSRAVPVLDIHSVDDPRALYGGGMGPPFPGTRQRVHHQPVMAGLGRWIERDGCPPQPRIAQTREGASGTADAGQTATLLVWDPCTSGAKVEHWKLTGVGHAWPGSTTSRLPERLLGRHTTLIDAAEEVWGFVSRFELDGGSAGGRR
jgi:polyhydroxybutyrate depolymerase